MRTLTALALTAATLASAALPAAPARAADVAPVKRSTAAAVSAAATLTAAGEGRRLYLKLNCYSCHGNGGTGGMGPNIVRAESGDVSEAVNQGEDGGMPSYRNYVTATDVANLAAYLQSIGSANEPKFKDWWVPVPPK